MGFVMCMWLTDSGDFLGVDRGVETPPSTYPWKHVHRLGQSKGTLPANYEAWSRFFAYRASLGIAQTRGNQGGPGLFSGPSWLISSLVFLGVESGFGLWLPRLSFGEQTCPVFCVRLAMEKGYNNTPFLSVLRWSWWIIFKPLRHALWPNPTGERKRSDCRSWTP
jgi:hypothetical protein